MPGMVDQEQLPLDDRAVVHPSAGYPAFRDIVKKAIACQIVRTDERRIACETRERLIGTVAVARGTERQHLPDIASGGGERVYPGARLRTDIADTEATGQARRMKYDSSVACMHRCHGIEAR